MSSMPASPTRSAGGWRSRSASDGSGLRDVLQGVLVTRDGGRDRSSTTSPSAWPAAHDERRARSSEAGLHEASLYRLSATGDRARALHPGRRRAVRSRPAGCGGRRVRATCSWVYRVLSAALAAIVRTGKTGMRSRPRRGVSSSSSSAHPNDGAEFDKAMPLIHAARERPSRRRTTSRASERSSTSVVATATVLSALLAHHPAIDGVLFDLQSVVARGTPAARAHSRSLGGRRRNFFDGVPAGRDGYLLSHVIHDWREDRACDPRNCRAGDGPRRAAAHRRDGRSRPAMSHIRARCSTCSCSSSTAPAWSEPRRNTPSSSIARGSGSSVSYQRRRR